MSLGDAPANRRGRPIGWRMVIPWPIDPAGRSKIDGDRHCRRAPPSVEFGESRASLPVVAPSAAPLRARAPFLVHGLLVVVGPGSRVHAWVPTKQRGRRF